MSNYNKTKKLKNTLKKLYTKYNKILPFHGWHHIIFVRNKAIFFAKSINADLFLVESAALTHDLNYIVKVNSEPEEGKEYRKNILIENGYLNADITRIEKIIAEAHTATRNQNISVEGKALSDADTLFKSLPLTPILFASNYIKQNKVDIKNLAKKIISEQNKLFNKGIYFYTEIAKRKYLNWAKTNLELWNNVSESLKDNDVKELLKQAEKYLKQ
ncbi:MAG: HD domain-containing protein [Patescibacteria group bacterium]